MKNIHIVDSFKSFKYLTQEISSFLLAKSTSKGPEIVEITSIAITHKYVKIIESFLNIMKTNYVRTFYS